MNKKEIELQKEIEKALEHEENLQKDQNEDPITFVKEKRDQSRKN